MNKLLAITMFLGTWLIAGSAMAQEAPEGAEALLPLIQAAQGGKWSLFVSLLIMVLVWLTTKAPFFKKWIKGEAKIWTAAVAGVLGAFATSIYTSVTGDGSVDWLQAVLQGLSTGLAAGGLWSLVGRKIMDKPIDKDGDGKLDSLSSDSSDSK